MNYEALDEALDYIEAVNENAKETIAYIIMGVLLAISGTFAGMKIGKEVGSALNYDKAKKVINDPKVQEKFKKLVNYLQKGLKEDKDMKRFSSFVDYNVPYSSDVKPFGDDQIKVIFHICKIDVEKLFKDLYKTDYETYAKDWDEPDENKPAPKLVSAIDDIDRSANKYLRDNKRNDKISMTFGYNLPGAYEDYESYYYDTYIQDKKPLYLDLTVRIKCKDMVKSKGEIVEDKK